MLNDVVAPKSTKNIVRKILIGVAVIFGLILLISSMFTVKQNEYAFVKQFGRVETVIDTPGLHFKLPFVQSIEKLPNNLLLYDMQASDVITKDKKTMILDDYVLWRITDPLKFYQNINTTTEAERRIDTIVFNALKNYVSAKDQVDIIAGRRDGISSEILKAINSSFEVYGIEVQSVEIKRLDLPDDNKESVYTRMISERSQMAASYTAQGQEQAQLIVNDTNKQKSIIISEAKSTAQQTLAQGESEYMKILAEAYNTPDRLNFYEFIRSMDAMKASLVGDNKTLILPISSPLTKLLLGYN